MVSIKNIIYMQQILTIPYGRLSADDDAVAKAKREELRRKLLGGDTITLKNDGSATNTQGDNSTISIPKGKLADDDALAKAKREELRRKLLGGDTITLKNDGSATNTQGDNSTISIPKGKLAAQWYETNPQLLALERIAMQKAFPNFKMEKLDDGRMAWVGKLNVGVYETKFHQPMEYHVMALYMNNHPHAQMGSSVRVYPILPNVQELIDKCGFRPYHLLVDSNNDLYLCTNEADNQKTGNDVTSAASVLGWACKWFLGYELVLTGDLDKDKFNQHGGI
jgi:L-rhamnose mutarotase